jgi:hypothetical protein
VLGSLDGELVSLALLAGALQEPLSVVAVILAVVFALSRSLLGVCHVFRIALALGCPIPGAMFFLVSLECFAASAPMTGHVLPLMFPDSVLVILRVSLAATGA